MFLNITSPPCGQQVQLQVLFYLINLMQLSCACGRAEYQVGVECCPMCAPGYRVHRHCTEFTSTTCAPCLASTFTDLPNGLGSCRSCTVCDAGLRVKRGCSSTSDTLCDPLEGHYCTDPIQDGCRGAVEHTKCSPGQYIKQNGTSSSDTVCGDCSDNTYSDGSFTSCRPHRQCPSGQQMIRAGTSSSDTKCEETQLDLITIVSVSMTIAIVGAVAIVVAPIIIVYQKKKINLIRPPNDQAKTETKPDTLIYISRFRQKDSSTEVPLELISQDDQTVKEPCEGLTIDSVKPDYTLEKQKRSVLNCKLCWKSLL